MRGKEKQQVQIRETDLLGYKFEFLKIQVYVILFVCWGLNGVFDGAGN